MLGHFLDRRQEPAGPVGVPRGHPPGQPVIAVAQRRQDSLLREFDQRGRDLIITSLQLEEGLGLAITNRLRRAAGPRPSW
ncbi:Sua5 family C-terminal domain-containing protein [Streptomyces xanthophaeus]